MKKMGKVARLAALLVLTLLFGLFPIESENNLNKVQAATTLNNPRTVADSSMNAKQKVTWDCVWFGAYPQSEVTSGDIYNKLKNATGWDENNDIVIDGNKYRRLKGKMRHIILVIVQINIIGIIIILPIIILNMSRLNGSVLEVSNGQALLLADKVLDNQKYNKNYVNVTWETSSIRSWLNGQGALFNQPGIDYTRNNFINTAFSENEQKNILVTNVINDNNIDNGTAGGNDTFDRIFLLAESQIYTEKNGFAVKYNVRDEARRSQCSSYAFAMGCWKTTETPYKGNVQWWLRSPGMSENYAVEVYAYGWVSYLGNNVDRSYDGVRPALHLNLSSSNLYSYAGTVCSDGTINNNTGNNNSNSANNNTGNTNNNKNNTKPSTKTTASKKPTKRALLPVEKMTGSLKSVKSPAKSNLAITWKKLSKVTGYHVQFSAKSNFKKGTIERKFKQKVTKTKVRPVKSKKKYYVRMRPYTKSGSKTYYGKWSKVKSVKIK